MLVVPVISTTLASVQKFLKGVSSKQIGLLVVDESGQATPQSALGAIWRAKKSIIVGDPLQVEPVDTVPEVFKKIISQNVPQEYKKGGLSVQVLADKLNKYGGYNGDLWLGCPLVVHRRCISPMFDISNKVAYEGRMINQTKEPKDKKFFIDETAWYDCKGAEKGNKDHTVEIQIKIATKLLESAIENYKTLGALDIFFITPFVSVKNSLKTALGNLLREKFSDSEAIKNWIDSHCGTVHTFQGKEANEVAIVLGCDKNTGKAAAEWIGAGPNIINVAVSRAKYRLAVIGDYNLFKEIKNMCVACEELKDKIIDGQVFLDGANDASPFTKNHAKLLRDLQKLNDKQLGIIENIVCEFVGAQNKKDDKNAENVVEQKQSVQTTAIAGDKILCPICANEIRESEKSFYCSGYKSGCKFPSIWKNNFSFGDFTKDDVKALCREEQTSVKKRKTKDGKEYEASFVLDKENDYKLRPIYN